MREAKRWCEHFNSSLRYQSGGRDEVNLPRRSNLGSSGCIACQLPRRLSKEEVLVQPKIEVTNRSLLGFYFLKTANIESVEKMKRMKALGVVEWHLNGRRRLLLVINWDAHGLYLFFFRDTRTHQGYPADEGLSPLHDGFFHDVWPSFSFQQFFSSD